MTHVKISALLLAAAVGTLLANPALAQRGPPPPANAQVGAPIDLTGQWVSIVTEDWRWRMVTPAKGDYASVPLTPAGKTQADKWDLAADNAAGLQCKAYGVGGLMRIPQRIRVSWQDPSTLKLETDAGQQTRLFHFIAPGPDNVSEALSAAGPAAAPTLQGYTKAQWYKQRQSRGLGFGGFLGTGGALRAVTRDMTPGYLRRNGVPYSGNAVVTEQYNVFKHDSGDVWLTITTIVDDPENLATPFITSTEFKKETDKTKWAPAPCRTDSPLEPPLAKKG